MFILFAISSYARKIDEIARQRDARTGDFDGMIKTGKDLVSKKDVTDTAPVKDKIKVSRAEISLFQFNDIRKLFYFYQIYVCLLCDIC